MRFLGATPVQINSPFSGGYGAAVYASQPNASGPELIRYRDSVYWPRSGRVLQTSGRFGAATISRARPALQIVKAPAQPAVTLPVEYAGATAWINVRPHRDGIELPTVQGALLVTIDSDGDLTPTIDGRGTVWSIELLAGGGVRFNWDWSSGLNEPDSFTVRRVSGPTSPASVSVSIEQDRRTYSATFDELEEAEYVFEIVAIRSGFGELLLSDRTGETQLSVTPDATGPDAVTILTVEER